MNLRFVVQLCLSSFTILTAGLISAQDYPNKTIRINTSEAGGGGDFVARIVAQGISTSLGQPVVVVNGFSVNNASEIAKATPDGYSLYATGSNIWVYTLPQKAPYDVERDFSPITQITRQVLMVAVHPSVPVKSIKELIALAKAKPGALNAGTGVIGGPNHLATELFKHMAGLDMVLVPYKGSPQAITALISGEVQMEIYATDLLVAHVKSGRLRPLAVTSSTPSRLFPELPTVAASGLPGYEAIGSTNLFAPAKTPEAIITRLNQEVVRTLNTQDVKEKFLRNGQEAVGGSPQELVTLIKTDMTTTAQLIKDAHIKVQ